MYIEFNIHEYAFQVHKIDQILASFGLKRQQNK